MNEQNSKKVSIPVLRRLPLYHYFLTDLLKNGQEYISATVVAHHFNFDPITVRKDLALTGVVGRPKIGFEIKLLLKEIEEYLGWGKLNEVVLVGCGDLGSALLGYEGFSKYGLEIIVAFDNDPVKQGTQIHGVKVLPIDKIADVCRRMRIEIAILTVTASAAQDVADLLVEAGIKGIWNFTPTALHVPENIVVQQQSMAGSLAVLINKVRSLKTENKTVTE